MLGTFAFSTLNILTRLYSHSHPSDSEPYETNCYNLSPYIRGLGFVAGTILASSLRI